MVIKAGSVTNLTDARFFAAHGIDYLGFCFDPLSPDYISPQNALAIKGWIKGPKIVAEFANQDIDNINNIISFFEPDVIEINSDMNFDFGQIPIIIRTSRNEVSNIQNGNYLFVLIEDYITGQITNSHLPIMIDISHTELLENDSDIRAYQIKGTQENEVGVKDYEEIEELLNKIRM